MYHFLARLQSNYGLRIDVYHLVCLSDVHISLAILFTVFQLILAGLKFSF